MRLKKLSIFGFKSFADKVVLDFDCEVIGIVGPNGCGKSNIVDAFKWVMGEQSAKSLRGDKMQDVLFAGSESRNPLNYAEVAVTLTDVCGNLPTPYEEVTIARRLFRSGESDYFINKENVRLMDVHSLLLGSGIGKNAFSVFEQGELDKIILLSPLERRSIFDEAAGISRFLLRKKESIRKLTTISENFVRAQDIHAEIEKQAKQLKKQASHAKSYQENAAQLTELEKHILLFRWKEVDKKNSEIAEQLRSLNAILDQAIADQIELEQRHELIKQTLLTETTHFKIQQRELNNQEVKLRVQETEISQQKQRLFEIKKREEKVKAHLDDLVKEQQLLRENIKNKKQKLEALSESANLKHEIKEERAIYLKKVQEESRLSTDLKEKMFRHEAKTAQKQALMIDEISLVTSLKEVEVRIEIQQKKVADLSSEIDTFKADLLQKDHSLQLLRKENSELQKEEHNLLRQIAEAESQQKTLQRLKEEMEGFSAGAKNLLKESKNEKSPIFHKVEPLFEYLVAHQGYELLLATAMKPYLDTLVVNSEKEFEEVLSFAKKKKISDFSIVIKSRLDASNQQGRNSLACHVESSAVANHFTSCIEISKEGHLFDKLGVFYHISGQAKANNVFARQGELKSITATASHLRQKSERVIEAKDRILEELKIVEKTRNEISNVHRKKEMDLIQENFHLQQAISDIEKIKKKILLLKKQNEGFFLLEEEAKEIEVLKAYGEDLKSETKNLLIELQKRENLLEKWQEIHQHLQILMMTEQQSLEHQKKLLEEKEELHTRIELTLKVIAQKEQETDLLKDQCKRSQMELKTRDKKITEMQKNCDIQEKELSQKRKSHNGVEKQAHTLEIGRAQIISEKEGLEQELLMRHSLYPAMLSETQTTLSMGFEETLGEIRRLKVALESAGAVNMTAIDEFQETQARFEYLDRQLKDLEESKMDLEKIIAKLDQESRKVFKKTFQEIRENFQKNFALLFNGGSADLTFTESSDILEAGVEITAKPPGKQMRSISLLSGGEKCLTALALLFSIFEVKPAPFCILDEVDAPLDDTNIERFTHILKKFTDKTQFIIVTHNKKTMSVADILLGVSMEQKGISKLISLAFQKTASEEYV